MAYAFVNAWNNGGPTSGTTGTVSPTGVTVGNLLYLLIQCADSRTINSVSDGSNTYSVANARIVPGVTDMWGYFCPVTTGGNLTITVTFSASVTDIFIGAVEYSGIAASPFDKNTSALTASGSSITTPSVTTTQNGELIILSGCVENAARPLNTQAGYTRRVNLLSNGFCIDDTRQTTAGGITGTGTITGGNSAFGIFLATFKETVSATYVPKMNYAFQPTVAQ